MPPAAPATWPMLSPAERLGAVFKAAFYAIKMQRQIGRCEDQMMAVPSQCRIERRDGLRSAGQAHIDVEREGCRRALGQRASVGQSVFPITGGGEAGFHRRAGEELPVYLLIRPCVGDEIRTGDAEVGQTQVLRRHVRQHGGGDVQLFGFCETNGIENSGFHQ